MTKYQMVQKIMLRFKDTSISYISCAAGFRDKAITLGNLG